MCRRVHYAGLTVRGTGPNITAIRLSEEAPLLTNRQIALYYNIWADSDNGSTVALQASGRGSIPRRSTNY